MKSLTRCYVFAKLDTIDVSLKALTQPNSDIAVTLREIAKFLRNLIGDIPSASGYTPTFSIDSNLANGKREGE